MSPDITIKHTHTHKVTNFFKNKKLKSTRKTNYSNGNDQILSYRRSKSGQSLRVRNHEVAGRNRASGLAAKFVAFGVDMESEESNVDR